MVSIQQQKEVADSVLALLGERYDVLLAGGAPRDWYFDREAKDLDFFVAGKPSKEELEEALGCALEDAGEGRYADAGFNTYNMNHQEAEVQIISVYGDTALGTVERFPSSLSKAWYDGECHYHSEFLVTVETGYLVGDIAGSGDMLVDKTLQKYPCLVKRVSFGMESFFRSLGGQTRYSYPNGYALNIRVPGLEVPAPTPFDEVEGWDEEW